MNVQILVEKQQKTNNCNPYLLHSSVIAKPHFEYKVVFGTTVVVQCSVHCSAIWGIAFYLRFEKSVEEKLCFLTWPGSLWWWLKSCSLTFWNFKKNCSSHCSLLNRRFFCNTFTIAFSNSNNYPKETLSLLRL